MGLLRFLRGIGRGEGDWNWESDFVGKEKGRTY